MVGEGRTFGNASRAYRKLHGAARTKSEPKTIVGEPEPEDHIQLDGRTDYGLS